MFRVVFGVPGWRSREEWRGAHRAQACHYSAPAEEGLPREALHHLPPLSSKPLPLLSSMKLLLALCTLIPLAWARQVDDIEPQRPVWPEEYKVRGGVLPPQ